MLILFLQGAALALPATLQPGPLQAFLASQALTHGWRQTLPAAAAPLATDSFIISLVLLVLTKMPAELLLALRVLGGAFLIYLAMGILRTWKQPPQTAEPGDGVAQKSFLKAALMNLVNPNAYLFWGIVAGPILLESWRTTPRAAVAFVAGFYLTFVSGLALFIFLVGSARNLNPRVHHGLLLLSGTALLAFGVWQVGGGIVATMK